YTSAPAMKAAVMVDATAAFQALLDAAGSGDTVTFDAGTFLVSGGLFVPPGVSLRGAGPGRTILHGAGAPAVVRLMGGPADGRSGLSRESWILDHRSGRSGGPSRCRAGAQRRPREPGRVRQHGGRGALGGPVEERDARRWRALVRRRLRRDGVGEPPSAWPDRRRTPAALGQAEMRPQSARPPATSVTPSNPALARRLAAADDR